MDRETKQLVAASFAVSALCRLLVLAEDDEQLRLTLTTAIIHITDALGFTPKASPICVVCNAEMLGKRRGAKTCSDNCRKLSNSNKKN